MRKVVASCIAMRGEVDAIAARLEKFRKVVSAAEEQLKNDKQCIRTDALRSPQRQRLVFLMRVQMSYWSKMQSAMRTTSNVAGVASGRIAMQMFQKLSAKSSSRCSRVPSYCESVA